MVVAASGKSSRRRSPVIAQQVENGSDWYVNDLGLTFVRIEGEDRDLWVSATEITVGDYARYAKERAAQDRHEDEDNDEGRIDSERRQRGREHPIRTFYEVFDPEYHDLCLNAKKTVGGMRKRSGQTVAYELPSVVARHRLLHVGKQK